MKICYIGDGRSIHLRRWVDHFFLKGNEIFIISYHPAKLSNARVYVVHHEQNPFLVPVTYIAETMQIAEIIRKIQPDFVHLHYVSIDGLAPALFKNVPLVVSFWGSDMFHDFRINRKFRMVIKYVLRKADAVTATSHFLAEETQKHLPRDKQVQIVPFGVDTGFFRPSRSGKKDRRITLCYIKSLERHYGPQTILSVMPEIIRNHPETELVMVGGGSQEDALKRLANDLGISTHVRFTGPLPAESVREVLKEADIFVMPTQCPEAFGVAALEAQAMEVPVLASRKGGIPEAVLDGETGILFDPDKTRELSAAITKLITNPGLRKQMGKKGRQFVSETYNWSVCAKKMEDIYFSLLNRGKGDENGNA